jgi:hypothetical protein
MVLNAQSANARFLAAYHHHVVQRWKSHYVAYDGLRSIYKDIKRNKNGNGIDVFDLAIQLEIQHMNEFIDSYLEELDDRLTAINADVETLVSSRSRTNSNTSDTSDRGNTGAKDKDSDKGKDKKKKKANKDDDDEDELFGVIDMHSEHELKKHAKTEILKAFEPVVACPAATGSTD